MIRTRFFKSIMAVTAACLCAPFMASAQNVDTLRVLSATEWPLYVTHAPVNASLNATEPYFIYIVLKRGSILRQDIRTGAFTTFLNIDSLVINPTGVGDERGLLGLAFHPNFLTNGHFYVNYISNAGITTVARYTASGGIASPGSGVTLLTINQPFSNHNGGWMAFGPDNFLYISSGDGGSANDPQANGQNINTNLGKMLRIDVDGNNGPGGNYGNPANNPFVGVAGNDEIWAYGLRNAWRCSFDRGTGALYIADVGQNNWEEINYQPALTVGGQNYGWRCYEGNAAFNLTGCPPAASLTFPFHVYSHSIGFSITSGYVYRGCAIPAISGLYFFADYGTARVWTWGGTSAVAAPTGPLVERTADLSPPIGGGSISALASFGEDAFGEMYIVRHSTAAGEVFRIVPPGNAITDCNGNNVSDCGEISLGLVDDCDSNGVIDSCQIATNPSLDCNNNGILDSCEILADPSLDCNNNGVLDSCEILADPSLDCDGNNVLDSCELAGNDCNSNGVLDACELCQGDADSDNDRDFNDITTVLTNYGNNYLPCLVGPGDADKNGDVNFADITAVLSNFGLPCP